MDSYLPQAYFNLNEPVDVIYQDAFFSAAKVLKPPFAAATASVRNDTVTITALDGTVIPFDLKNVGRSLLCDGYHKENRERFGPGDFVQQVDVLDQNFLIKQLRHHELEAYVTELNNCICSMHQCRHSVCG
jgi:hypothetical protein